MIANEPNQKAIDAGSAALLRLSDDYVELAKATARAVMAALKERP
jgi:hypothetical protein